MDLFNEKFRRRLIFAVLLFASLLPASCGTGGTPSSGKTDSLVVPPTGTHTVAIDNHSLTIPEGFTITRWVTGQDSLRMMALTSDGLLLVTEMGEGNVLGFRLSEENPEPVTVISGLNKPSGITVDGDSIYIGEENQVSLYQYRGGGAVGEGRVIIPDLPAGGHFTRTVAVGPDHKLYLAVGSSCNVCEETDARRAALSRCNLDGSGCEVFASGLRNTVGFTWQPLTGEIWGVDNGRDGIGDDLPPDEVNIIIQGKNYGWPYCYSRFMVNPEYVEDREKARFCEATEPPAVELQAHSAPLGLRFLSDPVWPADYQQNLFIAFHGSWNRTVPTGYKVVRVDRDRRVTDFITGWLDEKTGKSWGRPVDILFVDNKMYITDDSSGSIYRVTRSI